MDKWYLSQTKFEFELVLMLYGLGLRFRTNAARVMGLG